MVEELDAIRSEKPSLQSIQEGLKALENIVDSDDLATALLLLNELYADSSCRCEEKAASYGGESEETKTCERAVVGKRDEMWWAYRVLVDRLKVEAIPK